MSKLPFDVQSLKPGEKITRPGVYSLTIEQHHSDICNGPSISRSGLHLIDSKTPMHYWAQSYLNKDRKPQKQKDHFDEGQAAHHLFLGEANFRKKFSVRPSVWKDWRKDAAREWRDAERAAGKTVLDPEQMEIIIGMARSLERHPFAPSLLRGHIELSIVYRDPITGIWIKVRPDSMPVADGIVADLKIEADASPNLSWKSVLNYGYAAQGALIARALKIVLGISMTDFVLVKIEKEFPHPVLVTPVDNEWIYWGGRVMRRAINTFAECIEKNEWPGYPDERPTSMPDWLRKKYEFEASNGLMPEEEFA